MQQAVSMVKVKGQGHMITRSFYLDQDKTSIRWKPSRKVDAKIPIDCIREIRQGASTDVFLKCQDGMFDSSCCFSIIYGNQCDVLDLVARQQEDATVWTVGLKYLMAGMSEEESHTQQQRLRDQWLKSTFKSADKSGDGLLSIGEVIMLLHRLNVNLSKRKVRQMFKEADTNITDQNEGLLDFDEFVSFYKRISTRKEIYMLLLRYGNGKEYLTAAELAHFLETEQTMTSVSLRYCLDVIKNFEPVPDNAKNGWLGIDGFSRYLLSREGDIFNPIHSKVHQDMTRPLSHYYIAASHNTYLLGDQLLSKSSMDVYAFVLQNGCRCVEVDCWDGPDGEPMVYHGYTLTSKIPFKNVIQTINKYAFTSSPYPLIVSVENHCCLEQQKIMASYMKEIFGDHLNIDPPDRHARYLPSPEQLKYKILIKAKKLPPGLDERIESGEVSDEDSADEMEEQFKVKDSLRYKQVECFAKAKLASLARESASPTRRINFKFPRKSPSKRSRSKSFSEGAMDPETAHYLHQQSNLVEEPKRRTSLSASFGKLKLSKKKRQSLPGLDPMYVHSEEMTPEYSTSAKIEHGKLKFKTRRASEVALQSKLRRNSDTSSASSKENLDTIGQQRRRVSICTRKNTVMLSRHLSDLVKYTMSVGFNDFTYNTPCWELPSFGESKAFQLALNRGQQFTHFNKRKLSRCYPAAYRIDSSNYNPVPMWNCGIQLVALNYQTDGRAMQLNNAKFSTNGQCGFVLKPEVLCDEKSMFDPHTTEPIPGVLRKQLIIRIQSGQQLPKPPQSILGERGEIIDPYVEVEIIGIPIDCARRQTRTIQDNGFNPVWDETMVFTINLPELALVRIVVWDEDPIGRDFIGQKTLPFTSILPGYRHIRLEGLNEASIFVHITINDFSDKIKNKANRKRNILSKTGRQTTLEAPERVSLRKKSFTSKLRRQSSVPNMPSSSRRPRDAPAIHGIRTENNNADKDLLMKFFGKRHLAL
ncbi:1-phosphatidylinositol 4,5-bisphosphate phosphodiesterase eta-2-like [Saccoglossus kowalevskii]